jgi:hypothetical protein
MLAIPKSYAESMKLLALNEKVEVLNNKDRKKESC